MVKKIDCRNLACPEPVLKTKEALEEMKEGILEIKVNSFSSIQNIKRFAKNQGLYVKEKKMEKRQLFQLLKVMNVRYQHKTMNQNYFGL